MNLILQKILFYLRWAYYLLFANSILKLEYIFYTFFNKTNVKRRIFLSSGNLSLINVLTIIQQLDEKNTEDYLIIDTVQGSEEFLNINKEIAKIHNFKKILVCNGGFALFEIVKHNLFYIDEIFAHTNRWYLKFIQPIFNKSKYYIFDEGMGSLIAQPNKNNKHINGLFVHQYLGKIDQLGWEHFQRTLLDVDIFKKIANKISKQYPFDISILTNKKVVIFCGSYWKQFKLGREEHYVYECKIIEKLIKHGYVVIYKQHPREIEKIELPKEVLITNCVCPLDIYNLNIVAVVSISSTASIHPFYYWRIPGFYAADETIFNTRKYKKIGDVIQKTIETYSLNINILFEISLNNMTPQEVLLHLQKTFKENIDNLPVLSKNKEIRQSYDIYTNFIGTKMEK